MNAKGILASLFILSLSATGLVACGGSSNGTGAGGSGGKSSAGADGGAGTGGVGGATAGAGGSAAGAGGATAGAGGATAGAGGSTAGAGGSAAGSDGGVAGADGGAAGADGGAAGSDGGAAGSDGGAVGADGGASACNTVQTSGAQIAKTTHAGAAPTMTGGTIALGTYVLTAMDKYNGTQGSNTHRETWVVTAGHIEVVNEDTTQNNGAAQHFSGSWTTATNMLTLTITCPAGAGTLNALYTSADGKLSILSDPQSTDQEIHTLTKQ